MVLNLPKDLWINIIDFVDDKNLAYDYLYDFHKPFIEKNMLNKDVCKKLIKGLLIRKNSIKNILQNCMLKKNYEHQLIILTNNNCLSEKYLQNAINGRTNYFSKKFFSFSSVKMPNICIKCTYFSNLFVDQAENSFEKITITFENTWVMKYDYVLNNEENKIIKHGNEYFLVDNIEYPYFGLILSVGTDIKMKHIKGAFIAWNIFTFENLRPFV